MGGDEARGRSGRDPSCVAWARNWPLERSRRAKFVATMLWMIKAHPRLADALIAGALVVAGLVEGALLPTNRPVWLHEVLTVLVMGSIAWRGA